MRVSATAFALVAQSVACLVRGWAHPPPYVSSLPNFYSLFLL